MSARRTVTLLTRAPLCFFKAFSQKRNFWGDITVDFTTTVPTLSPGCCPADSHHSGPVCGEQNMSVLIRKIINTASAPAAIGPYSQSVVVDRTMYISGQLVDGGVKAQAKQALVNMGEILKAAGCDYTNVVKTTVLLADINDFNGVNDVYKTFFSSKFPARAAYQVAALPRGGLVEIEAVAVLGPLSDA
uniref:Reactive intermediate imine deaminase A homolog n=1 Tax=Gasterosteus aculeatus aculeatus TaxID=481459 RepID=A0AAQ4QUV4_GASAC